MLSFFRSFPKKLNDQISSTRTKLLGVSALAIVAGIVGLYAVMLAPGAQGSAPDHQHSDYHDHFVNELEEHEHQLEPTKPVIPFELSEAVDLPAPAIQAVSLFGTVTRTYPFIWPTNGYITSYMGPQHPLGIDIGLSYASVSPIVATARGTVGFVGGNAETGYGYYVVVEHGNGVSSLYAHFEKILVQKGQSVSQGTVLGHGGSTGKSTGKHLHFEIRNNGYLVDPLDLMPASNSQPQSSAVNCATQALVLDRGSEVRINFGQALAESGSVIKAASLTDSTGVTESKVIDVATEPGGFVALESTSGLWASANDQTFKLQVVLDQQGTQVQTACDIILKTKASVPSSFVGSPSVASPLQPQMQAVSQPQATATASRPSANLPEGVGEKEGGKSQADLASEEKALIDEAADETPEPTATTEPSSTSTTPSLSSTPSVTSSPVASPTTTATPGTTPSPVPSPSAIPSSIPATVTPTSAPAGTLAVPTATATPTSAEP